MNSNPTNQELFINALQHHAPEYDVTFNDEQLAQLGQFYEMLWQWNDRLHLVAPCAPEEFATRHVLESLCALPFLPARATVADIGSGGGLPALPLMIMRPDIHVTLVESSAKKHIYLHEANTKIVPRSYARIVTFRFEHAVLPPVTAITCRALDRFAEKFPTLYQWANVGCRLLLFAGPDLRAAIEQAGLDYQARLLPNSEQRYLFVVEKTERVMG